MDKRFLRNRFHSDNQHGACFTVSEKCPLVCLSLNRGFVMIHKPTLFVYPFLKRYANDRTNVGQEDLSYDPIDLLSLPMCAGIHGSATAEPCLDPLILDGTHYIVAEYLQTVISWFFFSYVTVYAVINFKSHYRLKLQKISMLYL